METIFLYGLALSGYCAKVRTVLKIKNLPFEESAPLGGHYTSAEHQQQFPPGSIPAIQHGDLKLFDSEAIVEYLEDISPSPSMRASDPGLRAKQRALAQFHNTRIEPIVRTLFPLVKGGKDNVDVSVLEQQISNLQIQLAKLCAVTTMYPFIGGETLCLADCGFPFTLRMAEDVFYHLGYEIVFSSTVADWLQAIEAHPIIGAEIVSNRAAVADWLAQF